MKDIKHFIEISDILNCKPVCLGKLTVHYYPERPSTEKPN